MFLSEMVSKKCPFPAQKGVNLPKLAQVENCCNLLENYVFT